MTRFSLRVALCALMISAIASSARADFISVYAWATTEANAHTASPATFLNGECRKVYASALPVGPCTHSNADVTFTTNGIDFTGVVGDIGPINNIWTWLNSSAFPIHNLSFPYVGNVNAVTGNTYLDPSIWEFVGIGAFTTGQAISILHADGVYLTVNDQVLLDAGGPGFATSLATYAGPSGNFPFQLIFTDCCDPRTTASVLKWGDLREGTFAATDTNATVPEPASLLLLGTGLVGAGISGRFLEKRRT